MKPKYRQPGFGRRVLRFVPYLLLAVTYYTLVYLGKRTMGPFWYWSMLAFVSFSVLLILLSTRRGRRDGGDWMGIEGRRRSKLRNAIERPPREHTGSPRR